MKTKTQYVCGDCGEAFATWAGKCGNCGEWNTLKEFHEPKLPGEGSGKKSPGVGLDLVNQEQDTAPNPGVEHQKTNIDELDRVLGGGFFPGSAVLFGGNPGIGKSTLALQCFLGQADAFYFSGEESQDQILSRAKRIRKDIPPLQVKRIFPTHSLENIFKTIEAHRPPFAVVDSIQMIGLEGTAFGSISQIRENAEVLIKLAKATGTTLLIIGHVTKNDELAGPRMLEHMVDCVLYLEGDRNLDIRLLRTTKNRFGSTAEVGVFEMQEQGLVELKNPSKFFLAERAENASGSAITVVREGSRNFLIELQSLTVKTNFGQPRRTAHGIDLSKLHLLLAVVSKFTPFHCESFDAYLNVVGGLRVKEPAADLAICAAILSSRGEREIPADTVILGEVGLSGEVRSVAHLVPRLAEAEKLGFTRAIIPRVRGRVQLPKKMQTIQISTVGELMKEILKKL